MDRPAKIVICKVIHALVAGIEIGIDAIVEHLTRTLPSGTIVLDAMLVMKIKLVFARNQNET